MSRSFAPVVSFVSAALAASTSASATTSHRSLEETVAVLSQLQRAPIPACLGNYQGTSFLAHCPDAGEARQFFITGQVIPAGFGQPIGYSQLNAALRAEYRLDADPDYVFASGYLYAIDHATKAVRRVIPVEVVR